MLLEIYLKFRTYFFIHLTTFQPVYLSGENLRDIYRSNHQEFIKWAALKYYVQNDHVNILINRLNTKSLNDVFKIYPATNFNICITNDEVYTSKNMLFVLISRIEFNTYNLIPFEVCRSLVDMGIARTRFPHVEMDFLQLDNLIRSTVDLPTVLVDIIICY